jgi:hypothetical protein
MAKLKGIKVFQVYLDSADGEFYTLENGKRLNLNIFLLANNYEVVNIHFDYSCNRGIFILKGEFCYGD